MGLNYLGNFVLQSNILPTLSDGQGQSPPAEAANQLQILFPALIFNYPSNLIAPPPPLPDTTEYLSSAKKTQNSWII